jgi:hypothetical protein
VTSISFTIRSAAGSSPRQGGIIIDLLTYSAYYDIALRNFGLMLGALTLARLASEYDPPGPEITL